MTNEVQQAIQQAEYATNRLDRIVEKGYQTFPKGSWQADCYLAAVAEKETAELIVKRLTNG
jgi:hypothetical protein